MVKGAAKFDENPKAGLAFLEGKDDIQFRKLSRFISQRTGGYQLMLLSVIAHNVISSLNDPAGVALFLKSSTRLSKRLLGEYLAKPANSEVLKAFVQLFNFHGVSWKTCEQRKIHETIVYE